MPRKIYLDVFLVINVLMDFAVLHITAVVAEWNSRILREILAAIFGGIWAAVCVIFLVHMPNLQKILGLISYVVIPCLMVLLVLGRCSIHKLFCGVVALYIVTFVMAGILGTGWYYSGIGYGVVTGMLGSQYLIPSLFAALLMWIVAGTLYQRRKKYGRDLYKVIITIENEDIVLMGLLDTGNVLNDPYTGKMINIVSRSAIENNLKQAELMKTLRMRLVPFQSVGRTNGMIPVIDISCMKVYRGKKMLFCDRTELGLYEGKFSTTGQYEVLLHSSILS